MATLVVNRLRAGLKIVAVKAPIGDRRKEISEYCHFDRWTCDFRRKGYKLEEASLELLGTAEKLRLTKKIRQSLAVRKRKLLSDQSNKAQITKPPPIMTVKNFRRLAKLAGGVAVIYVGAASEVEMKEKKDRFDDALHATRAAIEEGIIPGGGVAYIRAINDLKNIKVENEDQKIGVDIIRRALEEPLRQIVANAGKEGSVVVNAVKEGKGNFGYNARTDVYEDMIVAGVVDPTKVARIALENAASIAGMLLTTECVLAEIKEETPAMPMGGGMPGGMPGMY